MSSSEPKKLAAPPDYAKLLARLPDDPRDRAALLKDHIRKFSQAITAVQEKLDSYQELYEVNKKLNARLDRLQEALYALTSAEIVPPDDVISQASYEMLASDQAGIIRRKLEKEKAEQQSET